jgi:predicted ribosome quality control (RQC) complex YloA/Tae2 family protein
MYFDYFSIQALTEELNDRIVGGRIQKIYDLNEMAVGFEIYANRQRHYLVLDAEPAKPHVMLVEGKLRRGLPYPTQLGLLMRRYADGAVITAIDQPPWERILTFRIDSAAGSSSIIVEAIERRANVLLVQEGLILDCIRRVGPQDNRVRISLPGHDYVEPPPQANKMSPAAVEAGDIAVMLDSDPGTNAWRTLTRGILGLSPVLAREIIFQATGRANAKAGDTSGSAVFHTYEDVITPLLDRMWQPGNTIDDDGNVTAFAPYPVSYLPGWQAAESMSGALVAYYGAPVGEDAYKRAKKPVQAQLEEATTRVRHKYESLKKSLRTEEELAHLRQSGELLLAYQYTIEPGAKSFSAQYDPEGEPLEIKLDPALSAIDNAKRYFTKYEKAKRAQADVPKRVRSARHELAFLEQLATDLALAASWPEIDEVRDALERDGYWRGTRQSRPQSGKSAPMKVSTPDGFVIWVGRNSRQNDLVTFSKGSADDLWLHARGVPGAHVIVKNDGREIPEVVIQRAAELAAYFSAARGNTRTLVDVTHRKHVRKIKGGKPGMVTYRNEQPREVEPRGMDDD